MDDICPKMDKEKFLAYENIFKKYTIRPLLGIVPDNQDPNLNVNVIDNHFWDKMRSLVQNHNWDIAQHGYQHIYHTKDGGILNLNSNSETSGLPFSQQLDFLSCGQRILSNEGLSTDTYMAPSHSYDKNTLKALVKLGFRNISDGYSFYPYQFNNLNFVPCQMAMPRRMPFGIYTFCIHANTSTSEQIEILENFIKQNKKDITSFNMICKKRYNIPFQKPLEKTILWTRKLIKAL